MIIDFNNFNKFMNLLDSPVRHIGAHVNLHDDSSGEDVAAVIFRDTDALKEFTVERIGDDSKFFGFGICHKVNVKLRDMERAINVNTSNSLSIAMGDDNSFQRIRCFPTFKVDEVRRDENTNELSITAYDRLYKASKHYTSELGIGDVQLFALGTQYTIYDMVVAIAEFLGVAYQIPSDIPSFNRWYDEGANLEGSELMRDVLDDIAEATQTIYYLNRQNTLVFKRLDRDGAAVFGIDRNRYFNLDSKTNRRITGVCHVTELGDNVLAQSNQTGTIQYVRDNPFWELREDIDEIVTEALESVVGMTINQFECNWRGNFLLEVGDKLALHTKDGDIVYAYLVNDTLEYNGALQQITKWHYTGDDETESNPSNLGEALKQTFAKVDKINKQIDIVVSHTQSNANSIAQIQLDAESIRSSVKETQKIVNDSLDNINSELAELTTKVQQTITSEDLKIEIEKQIQEAGSINKITTTTGFTFDEDGLTVSKSGSEMSTTITEDGMTVYRGDEEMLTANNQGVVALNLKATTYFVIGTNSRFEDYGYDRTGCFWIGPRY